MPSIFQRFLLLAALPCALQAGPAGAARAEGPEDPGAAPLAQASAAPAKAGAAPAATPCEIRYAAIAASLRKASEQAGFPGAAADPVELRPWPWPRFAALSVSWEGKILLSPFACSAPEPTARIIWAHELGHAVAHMQDPRLLADAQNGLKAFSVERHELEADIRGSQILWAYDPASAFKALALFAGQCAAESRKAAGLPAAGLAKTLPHAACQKAGSWQAGIYQAQVRKAEADAQKAPMAFTPGQAAAVARAALGESEPQESAQGGP